MTTIMLNVDEKLKKDFSNFAKKLGTNPSNLMRMFMANTINTKKVSFEIKQPILDFEITPLNVSNWSSKNLEETDRLTKKLEKLLA
jgi:addiction module RelB/DinJ family antitoxin